MRLELVAELRCVVCQGTLDSVSERMEGDHIMQGRLQCACGQSYSVLRGIPRMLVNPGADVLRVSKAFGWSWTRFPHWMDRYVQQFLDWLAPATADHLRGRKVLDLGCGKGRHLKSVAQLGAAQVIGLDLGSAIELAFDLTREIPNVHVVQGDILALPFAPGSFDHAYSIGVLHHLPDPAVGFDKLVGMVRSGGWVSAWVYGLENNRLLSHISPLRARIAEALPRVVLDGISLVLAAIVYGAIHGVYKPLRSLPLPYRDYLLYISQFPFVEVYSIVLDQLIAPIAFYLPQAEVERWVRRTDLQYAQVRWHNKNSWAVLAQRV